MQALDFELQACHPAAHVEDGFDALEVDAEAGQTADTPGGVEPLLVPPPGPDRNEATLDALDQYIRLQADRMGSAQQGFGSVQGGQDREYAA